jgi:hypothetical protein
MEGGFMTIKIISVVACLTVLASAVFSKDTTPSPDVMPLERVIKEVTAALQEYQDNRGAGATFELPPLSTAEFDFKTTVAKTGGVTFSFLIFKFGTSHEKDVVNEVTYTYSLPEPKKSGLQDTKAPPTLKDELAQAIQAAALAVKTSSTAAGLPFGKLTLNLQYGVKWDVNGGASPVISIVTVGLSGDVNKNTVQSVKLVFGK